MIDIHNHILPYIDDGSSSLETSIFLLKEAKEQGIKSIILTPHLIKEMYEESNKKIIDKYNELLIEASKIGIDIFLGREIMCFKPNEILEMIKNNEVLPMNNSPYLLLEFSYTKEIDISEVIYNASLYDYKVIIAHIERYQYVDINEVHYLKDCGALIQVNAETIVRPANFRVKKFVKKLLDEDLVDFIASDIHQNRTNYMKQAYDKISKKYGIERAEKLFRKNAEKYLF